MKHHGYIGIVFFLALSIFPFVVYAQSAGIKLPVGGKVTKSGKSAKLVCAAQYGPIFITPYTAAPPGPYFVRFSSAPKAKKGGYILGMYSPIPDVGTCYNPETGAPIPAFELKPYGASK